MRWTDHKTVGLQYGLTALVFLLVGFLLMILMRWQLAWPGQPLPPQDSGEDEVSAEDADNDRW